MKIIVEQNDLIEGTSMKNCWMMYPLNVEFVYLEDLQK